MCSSTVLLENNSKLARPNFLNNENFCKMPRKKKTGGCPSPEKNRRIPTGQLKSELTIHEVQDAKFQQLQDMFKGRVDAEIVHMVLQESNWNVEVAVESLFTIAGTTNQEPTNNNLAAIANSIVDTHSEASQLASSNIGDTASNTVKPDTGADSNIVDTAGNTVKPDTGADSQLDSNIVGSATGDSNIGDTASGFSNIADSDSETSSNIADDLATDEDCSDELLFPGINYEDEGTKYLGDETKTNQYKSSVDGILTSKIPFDTSGTAQSTGQIDSPNAYKNQEDNNLNQLDTLDELPAFNLPHNSDTQLVQSEPSVTTADNNNDNISDNQYGSNSDENLGANLQSVSDKNNSDQEINCPGDSLPKNNDTSLNLDIPVNTLKHTSKSDNTDSPIPELSIATKMPELDHSIKGIEKECKMESELKQEEDEVKPLDTCLTDNRNIDVNDTSRTVSGNLEAMIPNELMDDVGKSMIGLKGSHHLQVEDKNSLTDFKGPPSLEDDESGEDAYTEPPEVHRVINKNNYGFVKNGSNSNTDLSVNAPEFVPSFTVPGGTPRGFSPRPSSQTNIWTRFPGISGPWTPPSPRPPAPRPPPPSRSSRVLNPEAVTKVQKLLQKGGKLLILLRGCPGSGKSTLAREIRFHGVVLSTDDFFMKNGKYNFDAALLSEAHVWNKKRAGDAMEKGISPVVIDNTNTQRWEMRPYAMLAEKYSYDIELLEPSTPWKFKARELERRNTHGVHVETIRRMIQRYEHNVTVFSILSAKEPGDTPKSKPGQAVESSSQLAGSLQGPQTPTQSPHFSTENQKPSTSNPNPSTCQKPSTESSHCSRSQQPSTTSLHPSTTSQKPCSSSLTPSTASLNPSTESSQSSPSSDSPQSSTGNQQSSASSPMQPGIQINRLSEQSKQAMMEELDQTEMNEVQGQISEHSVEKKIRGDGEQVIVCDDTKNDTQDSQSEEVKTVTESPVFDEIFEQAYWKQENYDDSSVFNQLTEQCTPDESEANIEWQTWETESSSGNHQADAPPIGNTEDEGQTSELPQRVPKSKRTPSRRRMAAQLEQPKLDATLKQQFLAGQWKLPGLGPHIGSQKETNSKEESDKLNILPEVPSFGPTTTTSTASGTNPQDFAVAYKVSVEPEIGPTFNGMKILPCTPRYLTSDGRSRESTPGRQVKLKLDKSCSTQDLQDIKPDLKALQNCFPTVSARDLCDILDKCNGDADWAVNVLLDSGMEYNNPNRPVKVVLNSGKDQKSPNTPSSPDKTQGAKDLETVDSPKINPSVTEISSKNGNSNPNWHNFIDGPTDTQMCDKTPQTVIENAPDAAKKKKRKKKSKAKTVRLSADEEWLQENSGLTLSIDSDLGKALQDMFGCVGLGMQKDSSSQTNKVQLSYRAARELHHCWLSTLQSQITEEQDDIDRMMKEDEELAKRLQAEEDSNYSSHKSKVSHPSPGGSPQLSRQGSPCVVDFRRVGSPAGSLKEIMDEQLALETSRNEYFQRLDASSSNVTLATRLKRQKLYEMFPTIAQTSIEEIFQSNNFQLGPTIESIKVSCGLPTSPAQNVMTSEAAAALERQQVEQARRESLQEMWMQPPEEEEMYQVCDTPDYQDFRAEADMHYKLRHECFQKAQEAYKRGMKQVATFYSQQGHLHTKKLSEANNRAAEKILEYKNAGLDANCLDLHGLHVGEALKALEALITTRQSELRDYPDKSRRHISVITGRGLHSHGGTAKLKPAVLEYLNRNNFRYTEPQVGVVRVVL